MKAAPKPDSVLRIARNELYRTASCYASDRDKRLSWKAVGVHFYLTTRPDGWKFHREDLIARHADARTSVKGALAELRSAGYLRLVRERLASGTVADWRWFVSEVPLEEGQWAAWIGGGSPPTAQIPSVGDLRLKNHPTVNEPYSSKKNNSSSITEEHVLEPDLFGFVPLPSGRVDYSAPFEELWELHARGKKKDAFEEYRKVMYRKAATHEQLADALEEYVGTFRGDFQGAHLENWLKGEMWNNVTHGNGDGKSSYGEHWDRLVREGPEA